jgi:hypothetical protein
VEKRFRNYELRIKLVSGQEIKIFPPLTLEFEIVRTGMAEGGKATLRVYNLGKILRESIKQDFNETIQHIGVELYAGYEDSPPMIFKGDTSRAWSVREGTNWITTLECYAGLSAVLNATMHKTTSAGQTHSEIFQDIIKSMESYGIKLGAIGDFKKKTLRATAMNGNANSLLRELSAQGFFTDLGKAYVLKESEYLDYGVYEINSGYGILSTPITSVSHVMVDIIFEPKIMLYQMLFLNAETLVGHYKVTSITHRGTISEASAGTAVTSLELQRLVSGQKVSP